MLSLRAYKYEDPEHDSCGSTTHAVLEISDAIRLPLCSKCLENLTRDLKEFNNTIFCHKCTEFDPSSGGWHYGGKCQRTGKDAECMGTCKEAISEDEVNRSRHNHSHADTMLLGVTTKEGPTTYGDSLRAMDDDTLAVEIASAITAGIISVRDQLGIPTSRELADAYLNAALETAKQRIKDPADLGGNHDEK